MIVVIDGPAGAGKSSTAKAVAKKADLHYIDSGAMYRGFTALYLACHRETTLFFEELTNNRVRFSFEKDTARVFLDGNDITDYIRSSEINDHVSEVAAMSQVRAEVLVQLKQIVLSEPGSYIAEGRDLGTVVFPDADLKIFLTADLHIRAQRRFSETHDAQADIQRITNNLESRDRKDSAREEAPLLKAHDAVEIDTTHMSFEEQVEVILDRIALLKKNQAKT